MDKTALLKAAMSGDTNTVKLRIDQGYNINSKDANGHTPIFLACKYGHTGAIVILLEGGADVKTAYFEDNFPLLVAGRSGYVDIVELLVEAGASVNCRDDDGETPLISAARCHYVGAVRLFVETGGSIGRSNLLVGEGRDKKPLIPETLESMNVLSANIQELRVVGKRVMERLVAICAKLQQLHDIANRTDKNTLVAFTTIIFHFCQIVLKCESHSSVARLIGGRARIQQVADVHEAIDNFVVFEMNGMKSPSSDWREQLEKDRSRQKDAFQTLYHEDVLRNYNLVDGVDRVNALGLLRYELAKHSDNYGVDELRAMCHLAKRLVQLSGSGGMAAVPDWFISRDDVEFHPWNRVGESEYTTANYRGTWLKTPVMIISTGRDLDSAEFEDRALRWYQLSHSHVIELYGASHTSKPFIFVTEFSSIGTMRSFLRLGEMTRHVLWQKLFEAALGLQYLHERSIIHGELRCDNILIGDDLAAKVAGFGAILSSTDRRDSGSVSSDRSLRWKARELLNGERASFASDIYAFGMCILEAVTGAALWMDQANLGALDVLNMRIRHTPHRPRAMNDSQWELVQDMCAPDADKRVKIGFIVNKLEKFAREECDLHHSEKIKACAFCPARVYSTRNDIAWRDEDGVEDDVHRALESCHIPNLDGSIGDALQRMRQKLAQFPHSHQVAKQVLSRLTSVATLLHEMKKSKEDAEVVKYCSILVRFQRYLRTPFSEQSVARYARSRKIADSNHVFHSDIDRLLDALNVQENDSIRDWRDEFEANMNDAQYHSIGVKSVVGDDERKQGGVTLVHFESSQTTETAPAQRSSATADQPWLLPLQELVFNETTDCIGEGSFGAVFRGVWLNTPVVVKFMGYKEDAGKVSTELLLHEVAIWHRLSHPHVVKLFGACHVGKRYFVCEYASNGTLSQYLKHTTPTHLTIWQKLYEASLGLQYLHGQNIVHNDLKCDNILVGADDRAKLTDFGLSSIPNEVEVQVDVKRMGAVHWKSPEYLTGGRPTFASDIYSFAMCILEAVTGDIPWGRQMPEVGVKFRVKKGEIPSLPEAMKEKQWNLVQLMTGKYPLSRVRVGFVVDKLLEFAHDEESSGSP